MSDNNVTQVPSEEQPLVPTTPGTQGVADEATKVAPSAPQTDADVQALKTQLAQYQQDIRNVKSVMDKKLNESTVQWQQKENELRQQLEDARLASMDEEGRAKYLKQIERQRQDELEEKATQATRVQADYQASLAAIQHFTSLGVPLTALVLDQGYDALFQSGYAFVAEGYKKASQAQVPTTPPLPPTAPAVATSGGSVPNLKPTWTDLIKQYGTAETVFKLVETGRLDPTIIPT